MDTSLLSQRITFIGCDTPLEDADFVLYGAPFDNTASFKPGTRFAPHVVRADSQAIELYSPYQDKSLADVKACDAGDLEVPLGNPAAMLDRVEAETEAILNMGKVPVMLGGEHLLTVGSLRSMVRHYPRLHIFHFDAHTDLRDTFFGQKLSHANVIRRAYEMVGDGRIHSFGIRSGERDEFAFGRAHLDFHSFTLDGVGESVRRVLQEDPQTPIYLTLDLDVLDPSVLPGTGTPEPGGVSFMELLNALFLMAPLRVVGFDVVELSPPYDPSGISNAVCWKLLRELLIQYGTHPAAEK